MVLRSSTVKSRWGKATNCLPPFLHCPSILRCLGTGWGRGDPTGGSGVTLTTRKHRGQDKPGTLTASEGGLCTHGARDQPPRHSGGQQFKGQGFGSIDPGRTPRSSRGTSLSPPILVCKREQPHPGRPRRKAQRDGSVPGRGPPADGLAPGRGPPAVDGRTHPGGRSGRRAPGRRGRPRRRGGSGPGGRSGTSCGNACRRNPWGSLGDGGAS